MPFFRTLISYVEKPWGGAWQGGVLVASLFLTQVLDSIFYQQFIYMRNKLEISTQNILMAAIFKKVYIIVFKIIWGPSRLRRHVLLTAPRFWVWIPESPWSILGLSVSSLLFVREYWRFKFHKLTVVFTWNTDMSLSSALNPSPCVCVLLLFCFSSWTTYSRS